MKIIKDMYLNIYKFANKRLRKRQFKLEIEILDLRLKNANLELELYKGTNKILRNHILKWLSENATDYIESSRYKIIDINQFLARLNDNFENYE